MRANNPKSDHIEGERYRKVMGFNFRMVILKFIDHRGQS